MLTTVRKAALLLPPVRALADRAWTAERAAEAAEHAAAAARHAAAAAERSRDDALARMAANDDVAARRPVLREVDILRSLLAASATETWLQVRLNGAPLWLPRDTLLTMVHCISRTPEGRLEIHVEERHLDWMRHRLGQGGTLLDVGCATGAIALPLASSHGSRLRIVAYEPAQMARALLSATLARNGIAGLEIRPVAVSDRPGEAEFREFLPDESGEVPFLPEASTLMGRQVSDRPHRMHRVQVVTLDEDALPRCGDNPVVVKIDIEGFEAHALAGAAHLIAARKPWFSIDIHLDPFGDGVATTEPAVRAALAPHGYGFELQGHVLLCSPPQG
jgi:FkbM family methyltransferase